MPLWNKECDKVIKKKRKAYRKVRRTHNYQDLMEHKQAYSKRKRLRAMDVNFIWNV